MGKPYIDKTGEMVEDAESVDWGEDEVKVAPEPVAPEFTIAIMFKWVSSLNDPIQYKPQSGTIVPQEVYLTIDVPVRYFVHYELKPGSPIDIAENCILTLDGYAYVQNTISAKLLKTYEEFKY